jgi:hypothetical protein
LDATLSLLCRMLQKLQCSYVQKLRMLQMFIESEPPLPPGMVRKGPQPASRKGGGPGAKAQTIRFLHESILPDLQLHALTFENEDGRQEYYFWFELYDRSGKRVGTHKALKTPEYKG